VRALNREDKVAEFNTACGQDVDKPMNADRLSFRYGLLYEEFTELKDEIAAAMTDLQIYGHVSTKTKERMLKEMADVQYVLSGMAVTFGLPLQQAFNRVHNSNLSKFDGEGKPILREDGKVLKGPYYQPPHLEDLVEKLL